MNIYLASRYSRHEEMRKVRDLLVFCGHTVTSRWIDLHHDHLGDFSRSFHPGELNSAPETCAPIGLRDLHDLNKADVCISFTSGDGGKGGRHVEFGYALHACGRLVVVGPREHVFHTLSQVEWYPDLGKFLEGCSLMEKIPQMLQQAEEVRPLLAQLDVPIKWTGW